MAQLALTEVIKYAIIGFLSILGIQAASNLIGSITGQNPSAQMVSTMIQTLVPVMVTMMPMMMIMNMMMAMMNTIMTPFQQMGRILQPPAIYAW